MPKVTYCRPLFVGQAPGAKGNPSKPFDGNGKQTRLEKICGFDPTKRFRCLNLIDYYPGKDGKGDAVPFGKAVEKARKIEQMRGVIIMAGKKVAEAFGIRDMKYFEKRGRFVLVPHPSGLNRLLNDSAVRKKMRDVLRGV